MSDQEPGNQKKSLLQRLMGKFTFSQKIYFICSIVGVLTLFLTYQLISGRLNEIASAEQELKGNRALESIRNLLVPIAQHSAAAYHALTGNGEAERAAESLQGEVNEAFVEFRATEREYRESLQISQEKLQLDHLSPFTLQEHWEEIAALDGDAKSMRTRHNSLIQELLFLTDSIGDSSLLSFDPSADTHYLIQPSLHALPKAQQLLSEILILDRQISQNGSFPIARYEMASLASALRLELERSEADILKSIENQATPARRIELRNRIYKPLADYRESVSSLLQYLEEGFLSEEQKLSESLGTGDLETLATDASEKGALLWGALITEVDALLAKRVADLKLQNYLIIALVLAGLGIGSWIALLLMRESNRFFKEVYNAVLNFSSGDLSSRAPPVHDAALEEMRLLLNALGEVFESLIAQLQKSGVQLTTATTQIAAAAKHQEGTVFQQEATVKQILVTAGEISTTAKDFAKTMNSVSETAEDTSQMANKGQSGLNKMEETMRQMVEASGNIASKLAVLNEKAGAITGVITTITKVADQTNLLSLNAAIEAEKAGEQGKSFAVIAREIRRLADQAANATLDIERMINEMMSAVSEGVMGVDKFTEEIRSGVEQVSAVGKLLGQIIERVREVAANFENVNKGMQAQSLGAEQINESILQLNEAAQQTTRSIRQFHEAIDQMTLATKAMQVAVTEIKKPDLENSPLSRFHK